MWKTAIAIAVLIVPISTVKAHHGHTSQFDTSKIIEIRGVITDLGFVNPHSYVYLDVTDENGETTNWHCEMRAASVMKRSGWTAEMFAAGTPVEIVGIASRREANGCYVETIAFNGGEPIERYAQIDQNKLKPRINRSLTTEWGDPNIDGDWAAEQRLYGAVSGPGAGAKGGPPPRPSGPGVEYTEKGKKRAAEFAASRKSRNPVAQRLDCQPRDFFRDWIFDQHPNRIIQGKDKIVLKFGFMDIERTIRLDLTEHPDDIEPSFVGHSIGRWEANVLIVDTVGFSAGGYRGRVHSESYHTVERFQYDPQARAIARSWIANDPEYWLGTLTGQDTVYLSDYPYESYNCDDRTVE